MESSGISSSLHDRLLTAVDRAVQVQEDSYALIEAQHAMIKALHETVAASERRRHGVRKRTPGCQGRDASGVASTDNGQERCR
jgi:hypothetical protein